MIIMLLGTHLFLTIRLKFPQRKLIKAIKLSAQKDENSVGDVSQFGALATSLAATIGTGNIVGVATAVSLGGPGAVFWCWLTGVFGIATKYAEAYLAVRYRVKTSDGDMIGGPMYALQRGLGFKHLAVLFCVFTVLAAFGIGNTVQTNSISMLVEKTYNVPTYITGIVLCVLTALVIFGGVKSIVKVCTAFVPFMSIMYVIGCLYILILNHNYLFEAVKLIVESAFTPSSAVGGMAGSGFMIAARYGIARGLFSNESGMGSAPIVAAAAQTRNPVRQALISSTGTFWDTVIICALTGLVLVSSIIAHPDISYTDGAALTQVAFDKIPVVGAPLLTFGIITFAFSTILGWNYYSERAVKYLGGHRWITPFRVLWTMAIFVGAVVNLELIWNFADCMNAFMAIPNLISVLLLSGLIARESKKALKDI